MRKLKQWAVDHKRQLWIGLGAFVFLYFVWPTPFIYTRSSGVVHRVNRFTGQSSYGSSSGWQQGSSGGSYESAEVAMERHVKALDEDPYEKLEKAQDRAEAQRDRELEGRY